MLPTDSELPVAHAGKNFNCQCLYSVYLNREVRIDFYEHKLKDVPATEWSLLLVNDGQDLEKMPFDVLLAETAEINKLRPLLIAAIHCGPDRKLEYGVQYSADYNRRGSRAGLYNKFLFDELMPFIRKIYKVPNFREKAFAGFSLGGLTALDTVWNRSAEFSKVGVFSGSLWWRRKAYEDGYNDETDRLMHLQIRTGGFYPWLKFYFQTGALDEKADRNNNGIIDAIDDTLDLIVELKAKGYSEGHIHYEELTDGRHDVPTWARAFPPFLIWAFGA